MDKILPKFMACNVMASKAAPKKSESNSTYVSTSMLVFFGRIISIALNATLEKPHAQFLEDVGKTDRN